MLSGLFRQRGFSVECERDGVRGLSRAASETFDLVILDVMLPGVDGFTGAVAGTPMARQCRACRYDWHAAGTRWTVTVEESRLHSSTLKKNIFLWVEEC